MIVFVSLFGLLLLLILLAPIILKCCRWDSERREEGGGRREDLLQQVQGMSLSTLFRFSSLTSLWHFDISLFICNIIHLSLWCSLFSCSVKTAAVSLLLGFNCFKNALISKRIISTYRQRTLRVHFIPDRRKERKEERKWEQIVISKCLNFKRDYLKQTGREDPVLTEISRLNQGAWVSGTSNVSIHKFRYEIMESR